MDRMVCGFRRGACALNVCDERFRWPTKSKCATSSVTIYRNVVADWLLRFRVRSQCAVDAVGLGAQFLKHLRLVPRIQLPLWKVWVSEQTGDKSPRPLGFVCRFSHLARVQARYSAARSFHGIRLDGFTKATEHAYSQFVKLVLSFGAFEGYANGLGLSDIDDRSIWFAQFVPAGADATIRQYDPKGSMFNLIEFHTTGKKTKKAVRKHLDRETVCPTVLAAAIRHVFVHGILTPHSNGSNPFQVASLSDYLADLLLDGVAQDFEQRVVNWQRPS